jgi:hypothetical protein
MVWTGPLAPVDPGTGRALVPVPHARPEDLAWLNRVDELAGRYAARYVLAGGPDDPGRLTGWITLTTVRA